jgi:hypothetical protein
VCPIASRSVGIVDVPSQSRFHDTCEFTWRILRRAGLAKERARTAAEYCLVERTISCLSRFSQDLKKTDRPAHVGPTVGEVNSRRKGVGKLAVRPTLSQDRGWIGARLTACGRRKKHLPPVTSVKHVMMLVRKVFHEHPPKGDPLHVSSPQMHSCRLDGMNHPIQRGLVQELCENRHQYASSIRCRYGDAYGNRNCD